VQISSRQRTEQKMGTKTKGMFFLASRLAFLAEKLKARINI
jgi:hypothetical protein